MSLRRGPPPALPAAPTKKKRFFMRWRDEWTQLRTLLHRSFMSKLWNRANLVITIGVAPVLALLISTLCVILTAVTTISRLPTIFGPFFFSARIVAMFLG